MNTRKSIVFLYVDNNQLTIEKKNLIVTSVKDYKIGRNKLIRAA